MYGPSIQQILGLIPTVATNLKIENNNKPASIMATNHLKMGTEVTPETVYTTNTSQTMDMSNTISV
jgi:hypothetical protein